MKISLLFGVLLCLGLIKFTCASPKGNERYQATRGSCNQFIDDLLLELKEDKEFFQEPLNIPDKSLVVSKKLIFVNYTGEAKIFDAHIFGMSTLHRDGDVIVDKKKNSVNLKIYLGAGELKMVGKGQVLMMGHGPKVTMDARISYVNLRLDIAVDSNTGTNPKLLHFDIEDTKGVKVKTTGLGPLNLIANAYIHMIGLFFKGLVHSGIEAALKKFIADKIKQFAVPIECLNSSF